MRRLLSAIRSIQPSVVIVGAIVSLVVSMTLVGAVRFLLLILEAVVVGQEWNQAAIDRLTAALDEAQETLARAQQTVESVPNQLAGGDAPDMQRQDAQLQIAQTAANLMRVVREDWLIRDVTWITSANRNHPRQVAMVAAFSLALYLFGAVTARVTAKPR